MANDEHLAEIAGGPLANRTSIFSHIEQGLRKSPHEAAVICMDQPANHLSDLVPVDDDFQQHNSGNRIDCLTLTYTQLHRVALTMAAGMRANGARPGSTILTLIPNGGESSLLLWTCIIMRLTFAALDPSALDASGNTELRNSMKTLKPEVVVIPNTASARVVDDAIEGLGLRQPLRILLSGNASNGWKSLLDLAVNASNPPVDENTLLQNARNDDPDCIHSVLFTSGTSAGRPKGCPQRVSSMTHILHSESWLINTGNCALVLQQAHNSRAIAPAVTLQTWREGGTVVVPSKSFAIEDTLDAIIQHRVTFIVLSPAMVHALAHDLASRPGTLDSVRTIQLGGDTVTKNLLMKCAALFPSARVCINHGMTEGGGFFTWPFFQTPISCIPYFGEICPIGAVAPGARLRIWDANSKGVTKRGEPGELHVCCESIIGHYLGGAGESSFYQDEKGRWFNTGDLAMMNEDDLVFILGRSKDMFEYAGTAIVPAALESCIAEYTGAQVSIPCLLTRVSRVVFFFYAADIARTADNIPSTRPQ
jgi:acyl-CoA synthetase (AMP-forming)/AMP-acid ligase II